MDIEAPRSSVRLLAKKEAKSAQAAEEIVNKNKKSKANTSSTKANGKVVKTASTSNKKASPPSTLKANSSTSKAKTTAKTNTKANSSIKNAKNEKKRPAKPTKVKKSTTKKAEVNDEEDESEDGEDNEEEDAYIGKKKQKIEPSSDVQTSESDVQEEENGDEEENESGVLKVGDKLPSITLQTEEGESLDVSTLKSTVIFTYPKANTPGCTTQACSYRDDFEKFSQLQFTIFGLSNDGPTSLKNWKSKKNFQYHLLSDPKRQFIAALTGNAEKTTRSHFIIDQKGKIVLSSVGVKPGESSTSALEFTKGL